MSVFPSRPPPPLDEIPEVKKEHSVNKRAVIRPRIAVAPNAGAKMLPGDRKLWVNCRAFRVFGLLPVDR